MLRPSSKSTRSTVSFLLGGWITIAVAAPTPPLEAQEDAAPQRIALLGATLIDGTGSAPTPDGVVLVEGATITCVGSTGACEVPDDAERVDLTGRYLTPGLVDAHVHYSQTGWLDGRPDGIAAPDLYPYPQTARSLRADPQRWDRSYLCSGITAVYDVGGHPWTVDLMERAADDPARVHLRAAGPLVTWVNNAALNIDDELYTFLPMGSVEEGRASVRTLVGMGAGAVKVWYLAPPPGRRAELDAVVMAVGRSADEAGLDLIVHATSLREAKVALRAGAELLVHSVSDQPVDQEFLNLLAETGAIYSPTLVVGANWNQAVSAAALGVPYDARNDLGCVDPATVEKLERAPEWTPRVPEPARSTRNRFEGLIEDGLGLALMQANLAAVHGSGATVVVATDAGNPLTLHGPSIFDEMEAMQAAGMSPMEVVVAGTRNGARALGREAEFGTLEAGKLADLLVLGDDPTADVSAFRTLTHVMRAGVLRPQTALAW